VRVRLTEHPEGRSQFCSDARIQTAAEWWRAAKGTVTIAVMPRGVGGRMTTRYRATLRIEGAEFVSADGARLNQTQPIVLTVFGQ
jgi:hypothetical protein